MEWMPLQRGREQLTAWVSYVTTAAGVQDHSGACKQVAAVWEELNISTMSL